MTAQNKVPVPEQKMGESKGVRIYAIFCLLMISAMAIANHVGWFPTYGIFSGENSLHSSYRSGYRFGGGGIHGK
jgi:hypothetical protein